MKLIKNNLNRKLHKKFLMRILAGILSVGLVSTMLPVSVVLADVPAVTSTKISIITSFKPQVTNVTTANGFTHPGLSITKDQLDNMQTQVRGGYEPWAASFDTFRQSPSSSKFIEIRNQSRLDPTKPAYNAIDADAKAKEAVVDANAAFSQTIMWYVTGNEVYRKNAMNIIRLWSQVDPALTKGFSDSHITMGTAVAQMTNAAELLRYTQCENAELNWKDSDTLNYQNNFLKANEPFNKISANGTFMNNYWMNQHGIVTNARMADSIFRSSTEDYGQAVEWTTVNSTVNDYARDGSIKNQIREVTKNDLTGETVAPNIQLVEMFRDEPHAYGNIAALSTLSQMAYSQGTKVDPVLGTVTTAQNGVNLYNFLNNRLLAGANVFSKYNLGNNILYVPTYNNTTSTPAAIGLTPSDTQRGQAYTFNLLYSHYKYVEKKDMSGDDIKYVTEMQKEFGSADLFYTPAEARENVQPKGEPTELDEIFYKDAQQAYNRIQAYGFTGKSSGVSTSTFQDVDGVRSVLYDVKYANNYTWYKDLDAGTDNDLITARIATNSSSGVKADVILLDNVAGIDYANVTAANIAAGEVIGTIISPNTGWWTSYNTVTAKLTKKLTGKHNIALKYYGSSNALQYQIAFDWFSFSQRFAGSVNMAIDADTIANGAVVNGDLVDMTTGAAIGFNKINYDSGNSSININVKTSNVGQLELRKGNSDGELIAVYNIPNTNGVVSALTLPILSSNRILTGLNDISLVYKGEGTLSLKDYQNIALDKAAAIAAGSTVKYQLEDNSNVIKGDYSINTEGDASFVSVKATEEESTFVARNITFQSDRTAVCVVSLKVRSNGIAKVDLKRDSQSAAFKTLYIPDTKGQWTTINFSMNQNDISLTDYPAAVRLLYLSVIGTGATVDFDNIELDPVNKAPIFNGITVEAADNVYVGEKYKATYQPATDANNDAINYDIQNTPSGSIVNNSSIEFSWIPKTEDIGSVKSIFITANDGITTTVLKRNFVVYSSLENLISEVEKPYINTEVYTITSLYNYKNADKKVRLLMNTPNSSDELTQALSNLKIAVTNLVAINQTAADKIKVINNVVGTPDVIKVSGYPLGSVIKVYDTLSGGNKIGEGTVTSTSSSISIPQIGAISSYIYVTVTEPQGQESDRIAKTFAGEDGIVLLTIEAESYNGLSGSGMGAGATTDVGGGKNLGNIKNNFYTYYNGINLDGMTKFNVRYAGQSTSNAKVEVRLDSSTGTLIGTCNMPATANWNTYVTTSSSITATTGTHNLYFVYKSSSTWVANINWFQLATTQGLSSNKTSLDATIATVQSLKQSDYTTDSWVVMQNTLNSVNFVNNSPVSTQTDVDTANALLKEAIDGLTLLVASEITSVISPEKDATRLTLPIVPDGYTIAIKSVTPGSILTIDGAITPPTEDIIVSVVFVVTKIENGITTDTQSINVLVPASNSIISMHNLITKYAKDGKLGDQIVAQLTNDLNQAQHQLDKGSNTKAIEFMNDVIKHLNNNGLAKVIDPTAKNVLINDAKELIKLWQK